MSDALTKHLISNIMEKNIPSNKELHSMSFLSRISLANKSIIALVTIAILIFGAITIPTLK